MNSTAKLFETLGHEKRLEVMSLLMRRHPQALCAGQISDILGVQPSTLSAYLKALVSAQAITQEREGTRMKYRPDISQMRKQFEAFLTVDMNARIDMMPAHQSGIGAAPSILFLCPGNSGRSQLAEVVFRDILNDRFLVASAGTSPANAVNAQLMLFLKSCNYQTRGLVPKSIPEAFKLNPLYDFIVTLCSTAADRGRMSLPPVLSFRAHWPVPPLAFDGQDGNIKAVHEKMVGWAKAFAQIPFATMPPDLLADRFESISSQGEVQ